MADTPRITARPTLYIDVIDANGHKLIYDVATAKDLYDELGAALKSLEGPPDESKKKLKAVETPEKT